jgi:molybdopterin molybdotransferase
MTAKLTEIDRARELVLERVKAPLDAESVVVAELLGRVLAADVSSADAIPSFDNSAMDGYAARAADLATPPTTLRVAGESRAGHPADRELQAGEVFAISTGAMVPAGADTVVRVEDTAGGDAEVIIEVAPAIGANIRRAGEDVQAGETVIAAGAEVDAAAAGVIASVGLAEVQCTRRPRVAVLTTGDELREPGEPLEPGAIRNSNAYALAALIAQAGAAHAGSHIVRDDRDATRDAFATALDDADVVVVSGGVSVGEHDHVRPALEALGVEQVFWGVALRPGKPTFFGIHPATSSASRPGMPGGSPTLVFGLPGNPVSAMVTFHLFVRPALRALLGARDAQRPRTTAILDERYEKQPGRAHLIRVRLELRDDGWHARPTKEQGSHVLTSMLDADALAIVPTGSASVEAGRRVEIELL